MNISNRLKLVLFASLVACGVLITIQRALLRPVPDARDKQPEAKTTVETQDAFVSLRWARANLKGHPHALWAVGNIYSVGDRPPILQNDAKAWQSYLEGGELGDPLCQFVLGDSYYRGDAGRKKDPVEAAKWLLKAAMADHTAFGDDQEHLAAQCLIANCYYWGYGVDKDEAEGLRWLRTAADHGDRYAQEQLTDRYFTGEGAPKDLEESLKWARRAAAQGGTLGQLYLGSAYATGRGVPKNYVEGYKWLNLVSSSGAELLEELEKKMTVSQIAEGQRLSQEFVPKWEPQDEENQQQGREDHLSPKSSGTAFGDVPRLVENGLVLICLLGGNFATVKDLVFEGSG